VTLPTSDFAYCYGKSSVRPSVTLRSRDHMVEILKNYFTLS